MENNVCIRIDANIKQINNCKDRVFQLEDAFHSISGAINLAGNTVRLKILFLLSQEQELCVCDLSDILAMNISAISQHLRKLKDRNIIKPRRKAQTIYYSLEEEYNSMFLPFFNLIKENKVLENA